MEKQSEEVAREYLKKGLESLKVSNYRDAIVYFSRAYSSSPKSEPGELAYLYLGKSYALYSYASGSRRGILASVGYLNQYPFHYKVPRFLNVQREFVADSYLLLQWYESAGNIYANLYGETERPEYMIKYGYASALSGSIEGFTYLRELGREGVPEDYLDVYLMTMGFFYFNLGKYKRAIEYMTRTIELNPYLREDPHLLFRLGVSYYKEKDWRKAILYLELSVRNDPFETYKEKANFYLALINLETKNFREAFRNLQELTSEDRLFYRKLPQILFSSLWMYEEFLKVYGEKIGDYRSKLLQIGWLNVENPFGDFPLLGIYYFALKTKELRKEEAEFIRLKKPTLKEIVLENEIFSPNHYLTKLSEELQRYRFYIKEDALFLRKLFSLNEEAFLRIFKGEKERELLARSLVFLGDGRARSLLPFLRDRSLSRFLEAKVLIVEGRKEEALPLIEEALRGLKGKDRLEAELLLGYLSEDAERIEKAVKEIDFEDPRFSGYATLVFLKLGDAYYSAGDLKRSALYYRKIAEMGPKDEIYWWAMFRLALIGERTGDEETIRWVVKRAKGEDNIMSRVITVLWEG